MKYYNLPRLPESLKVLSLFSIFGNVKVNEITRPCIYIYNIWLVVWNIWITFPYIGNTHLNWLSYFFRGVGIPPTRNRLWETVVFCEHGFLLFLFSLKFSKWFLKLGNWHRKTNSISMCIQIYSAIFLVFIHFHNYPSSVPLHRGNLSLIIPR